MSSQASLDDTPQSRVTLQGYSSICFPAPRSLRSLRQDLIRNLKRVPSMSGSWQNHGDVALDPNRTILKIIIGGETRRGMGAESGR